jgi:hypothetical protein
MVTNLWVIEFRIGGGGGAMKYFASIRGGGKMILLEK